MGEPKEAAKKRRKMTIHQEVHDQNDLTEEDYKEFESKLLSSSASTQELERICMTLAHTPTKQAQDLLSLFKESNRAHEVDWLDFAVEEGQFHYHSPETEQEERDYLALKVVQELLDSMIEIETDLNEEEVKLEKLEIQHQAVRELVEKGELEENAEKGFHDLVVRNKEKVEGLRKVITVREKTCGQIEKSIQTEKYKDVDPMSMRNIHW
jgi:hypothetical protein